MDGRTDGQGSDRYCVWRRGWRKYVKVPYGTLTYFNVISLESLVLLEVGRYLPYFTYFLYWTRVSEILYLVDIGMG